MDIDPHGGRDPKPEPVGLLSNIRVLDFGRYVAGPYCACLLADLGADVIRIERVEGGEDRLLTPLADNDAGAMFLQVNRNKRGITLDPTTPAGREVLDRLVVSSDVVVANLPDRALMSMGLDYERLCSIREDIIVATVDAFGASGPFANLRGFDGVAQAMSGIVHLSGPPDEPSKSHLSWVDFGTASLTALGVVAALFNRGVAHVGQLVQTSLLRTALSFANYTMLEQHALQSNRKAAWNRSQVCAPADIYRCSDGWIIVQVIGERMFQSWAKCIERSDLIKDPRFTTDLSRGENGQLISDIMTDWTQQRTTTECLALLTSSGLPAAPVLSPQEALDHDQVKATARFQEVAYPGVPRDMPMVTSPISFMGAEYPIRRRPPTVGEHTSEVLAELGYSADEIDALRTAHVV